MKPLLSALLFPQTEPSVHDIGRLLFFFNTLSYYLPTESTTGDSYDHNLFKNLCNGYVPAPLHKDLTRFNRLVREMENSRPDDLARLFSSAISPLATGQIRDKDEASTGNVLSALQKDDAKEAQAQHKERLWQARLILKLAEIHDRREIEVRKGLARVSSDEQKIFASLEGLSEEEDPDDPALFPDQETVGHPNGTVEYPENYSLGGSSMLLSLRIKAWAELFLADPSPNLPFSIVTTSPESGNIILDGYENSWRKTPQKLFSLSIPTSPGLGTSESADRKYFSNRNKLHLAAKEELKYFESFLRETAVSQDSSSDKDLGRRIEQEHLEAWEEKIKLDFPRSESGYQKLDFYCFPGISTAALLQRLFHLEPTVSVNEQGYSNSILAILHV